MHERVSGKPDLDKLVNGLQDLVYVTDPGRRIIYANEAFATIFKLESPGQVIGKSILDFYVEPAHRKLFERAMRERGGRLVDYYVYVKRATDEPFFLSVDSNWINGSESMGIEGTGRDVTELVEFLGSFFQTDHEGVLTFCSPMFAQLFGQTGPEKLIGKKVDDVLSESRRFVELCEQAARDCDSQYTITTRASRGPRSVPTKRLRMIVSRSTQQVEGSTKLVGYQGTFEDITASEEAREELEETHRIHELLMAKSQDGIYVVQGDKLKLVNSTFCSIVERDEKRLLDKPYATLIHPEDRARVHEEVERKLAGEERPPYDFMIITGTGRERILRAFSGHCTMRKVDSVYGYVRDITEELLREEELKRKIEEHTQTLKEALDDKRVLLETVVHEMDAPTVAIAGIVERLVSGISRDTMSIPKQLLKLGDISDLCQLMFMMVRNVSLAEMEEITGSWEVRYLHIEGELIRKAANFMKPLLRNRDLPLDRMAFHLRGAPSFIRVNSDLFLQVFFNLFSNAVKYATYNLDEFKIEISSEYSSSGNLLLHFSDWGIGIPEGESATIFQKRKRGSNLKNSPGMGLGLWVARRILHTYECDIWVESQIKPTTFSMSIPKDLLTNKIT